MTTITKRGTIRNQTFTDTVHVKASKVHFKNCTFHVSNTRHYYGVRANYVEGMNPYKGIKFSGCRFIGGKSTGLLCAESFVHECEFFGQENDGIKIAGDNCWVRGNLIHGGGVVPKNWNPKDPNNRPHADGISVLQGNRIAIEKNRIISETDESHFVNSAIFVEPLGSDINTLYIYNNTLNGGGYTLFVKGQSGFYPRNVHIFDNRFGSDFAHGPTSIRVPVLAHDNVFMATGAEVPFEIIHHDG